VSPEGSVSRWLGPLQEGNPDAAKQLWERYFVSLVQLARKRLGRSPARAADAEDVALSAFDSFCRNSENGRFPELHDRNSLWRVLAVITARKAARLLRDEARLKRGGAVSASEENQDALLKQVFSREPSPELAAQMAEECERLLGVLGDEVLRRVAVWRLEGHSVEEIAGKIPCSPRSVKRRLHVIRILWEQESPA
jgi:DNA-directed RNA polymerase specialized sigma24 family protein